MSKYYPNDQRFPDRVREQEAFLQGPSAAIRAVLGGAVIYRYMLQEYRWMEGVVGRQQSAAPSLAKVMRGEVLNPANYIKKLLMDRISDGKAFAMFYQPHPEHHVINWLLQRSIMAVENAYEIKPIMDAHMEDEIFTTLAHFADVRSLKFTFNTNTLKHYVMERYLNGGVPQLGDIELLWNDVYAITSRGPIIELKPGNDRDHDRDHVIYTRYGAPNDPVENEDFTGFQKIYVK